MHEFINCLQHYPCFSSGTDWYLSFFPTSKYLCQYDTGIHEMLWSGSCWSSSWKEDSCYPTVSGSIGRKSMIIQSIPVLYLHLDMLCRGTDDNNPAGTCVMYYIQTNTPSCETWSQLGQNGDNCNAGYYPSSPYYQNYYWTQHKSPCPCTCVNVAYPFDYRKQHNCKMAGDTDTHDCGSTMM